MASFRQYKSTEKRKWVVEHSDLGALFSNIQSKLKSMNRPAYVPPEGLAPEALDGSLDNLTTAERKYYSSLNAKMRAVLDALRKEFAEPANAFLAALAKYRTTVTKPVEGDLAATVQAIKGMQQQLTSELKGQLPLIKAAEDRCIAANIEENEYSDLTYDDLQYAFEQINTLFTKKINFLETQIAEAKGGVPPEKMTEFRESFDHFDVNHDHLLERLEAKSCFASLGIIDMDFTGQDKEFDKMFNRISGGKPQITFDQYVAFMTSQTEDTVSPTQLAEAFGVVSGSKDWITEADMRRAQLTDAQVEYLKASLPKVEGGWNHKAWLAAH
eukprot:TRINITY_DN6189_c0_g1_i1.p1 TRINITY_DN6189_c0_g1~~TRINITY_DN6189_c0_g1_i1.p1  ORF type:complete len:343 (-),score=128.76 TRINITY_DN6189_c0_g1_i1:64-1047(-)